MNKNVLNLCRILSLAFIISGAFTFLFAVSYWNKNILGLSLVQLMNGSIGYYIIQTYPKITPLFKKEK